MRKQLQESFQDKEFNLVKTKISHALNTAMKKATFISHTHKTQHTTQKTQTKKHPKINNKKPHPKS